MKECVYSRVPRNVKKKLEESKDQPALIQDAISDLGYKCPMCNRAWSKDDDGEQKSQIAARIDPKVYAKVSALENTSRYICVALQVKLGICPVCNKKMR